jgi:hypothetical protein
LIVLNLTDREVEVSESGEQRALVNLGFGRELEVRSVECGVAKLSFGYVRTSKGGRYWHAKLEMLRVENQSEGPGKTRAVSMELRSLQPASGFVVRGALDPMGAFSPGFVVRGISGFVYCTAAKVNIALRSDVHGLFLAPSTSRPEVRAEKTVLTVSSGRAQAIAYLQHSVWGIEVSLSCNGEGIRSARLELLRSARFGTFGEFNVSETLLKVEPGRSGRVTWSPVNGPPEPLVVIATTRDFSNTKKFQRILDALGCKTRVDFLGRIESEFGDFFVVGDHRPVRHSIELLLDVPRRPDVRERAELEVVG